MSERFYPNGSSVYVEADGVGVRFCAAYSEADAQRIAAALNSQAQLVEALRRVQEMMPPRRFDPDAQVWLKGRQINELHERLDDAAALAAAGVE